MKGLRWVIPALSLLMSVSALSQVTPAPRQPIILARPAEMGPRPDPTGVYQGPVTLTEAGTNYQQVWRVELQAQRCPDCDPGVYYFDSTDFEGVYYTGGKIEKGGIQGVVGENGTLLDFSFFVANCPFISGNSYLTNYRGGNFGELSGTKLTVKNGLLSGSISGRDCLRRSFTANVSLNKVATAPALSCVPGVRGDPYYASFATSDGGSLSNWPVDVIRSACILSGVIADWAAVEGTMTGASTFNAEIEFLGACPRGGHASGTGTILSDGTIEGTFSLPGGVGCCALGSVTCTGSFAFSPR